MSCMKRLKSVGERTEPCGTPLVYCFMLDDLPLCSTYPCLPERKLESHFLRFGWIFVSRILLMSRCLGTVSKALLISMVTTIDLNAGLDEFRPSSIVCVRFVRRVLVECWGLKPCCEVDNGMCVEIAFSTSRSRILEGVHSKEIGRYGR